MLSLKKTTMGLRPRSREKGSAYFEAKKCMPYYGLRRRALFPEMLAGSGSNAPPRRTIVAAKREAGSVDPGPKGKRVAWKTSVGLSAGRDMKQTKTLCVDLLPGGWTESGLSAPGDAKEAGGVSNPSLGR
jgi:hypothetical protein